MKKKSKKTASIDHSIYESLFPRELSKSDRTKLQILEAAITTYGDLGVSYVSYEDIARTAKISRPLIQHYYPKKNELFVTAIKLVRAQFQEMAISHLKAKATPKEQFAAYVGSTFLWVRDHTAHAKAWLFFVYLCPQDKELRQLHRELTQMGQERIAMLIKMLNPAANEDRAALLARSVQRLIAGGMLELSTLSDMTKIEPLVSETLEACLALIAK